MHTLSFKAIARALVVTVVMTVVTAMASMLPTDSLADPPPGKGNPNKGNSGNHNGNNSVQSINNSLSNTTADLITAGITIAAARALAVDVGATGFKPLPPGIAKNLARGKPLPPGIATRNLPSNLLKGLPYYDGYQWLAAGTDLLLINTASRVIADVLTDALR